MNAIGQTKSSNERAQYVRKRIAPSARVARSSSDLQSKGVQNARSKIPPPRTTYSITLWIDNGDTNDSVQARLRSPRRHGLLSVRLPYA